MMKKILVLVVLLSLSFVKVKAQDEDVMFQAFDWGVLANRPAGFSWYNIILQNRAAISGAGIDMVWMPPPSDAASLEGYLPRELYNFNSNYGTEAQLRSVVNAFHGDGVKMIGDIVINHRVGTSDAVSFTNPAWPTFYITADDEGRNFVNYPVNFSINSDYDPPSSIKDGGGTYGPARDLDHDNPAVRQAIKDWMNFLKNDIGFDGWRYDFVHGYNPIYNKEYNDATNTYFSVGELLEGSRQRTINWVDLTQGSSSAFDFNTKKTLGDAIRDNNFSYLRDGNGKASGMIGLYPQKSVTFLENHDTGLAQQCCGPGFIFPSDATSLRKGYAYILTHPGIPMVFWTHFFDAGSAVQNAISDIISIRKDVRIFAGSALNIVESRPDLYAAYVTGRAGEIAMKLGQGSWSPAGAGWTFRTSGTDYAIWTRGGGPVVDLDPFTLRFQKPSGFGTNINAYFYDAAANTTLPGTSGWPGQSMSQLSGSQWYAYTIDPASGVEEANIRVIFNDASGNQTADLSRSSDGWYNGSVWSGSCPGSCPGGNNNNFVTLNFERPSGWGSSTRMYLYNKVTNSTLSGTSGWPGALMTNSGVWSNATFTKPGGVNSSDVGVVFNNGNGAQTVDLTRGIDGWFSVTGSLNGKSTGVWSGNCPGNCPSSRIGDISSELGVYPNPFTDHISIVGLSSEDAEVVVTNAQGIVVFSKILNVDNGMIDLELTGKSGLYIVSVSTSTDQIVQKLMKR